MKKRSILLIISIIVLIALIAVLFAACSSVKVEEIRISETSKIKKDYLVGESLNLENIIVEVVRSDMKIDTYILSENLGEFKVSNFNSSMAISNLPIVITYRNTQTSFLINIHSPGSGDAKMNIRLSLGMSSSEDSVILKDFGSILDEAEMKEHIPEREGFVFDGWYKDADFTEEYNFLVDKLFSDTVIYAKWAKIHKVTFLIRAEDDVNDEYINSPYQSGGVNYRIVDTVLVKHGESIAVQPPIPERPGKRGVWSPSLFENIDNDISAVVNYQDIFLKVSFKYRNPSNGAVTEINSINNIPYGTNLTNIPEYMSSIIEATNALPTTFKNIVFSSNWQNAWATPTFGTSMDNVRLDTEFFAIQTIREIEVNFELNYLIDNNTPPTYFTEQIEYGKKIIKPTTDPVRENYVFDGWYKESSCIEPWKFASDILVTESEQYISSLTLYAKWTAMHKISFMHREDGINPIPYNAFDDGQGNLVNYLLVKYGVNFELPEVPYKEGYSVSWNSPGVIQITGDQTITTNVEIKKYTVSFFNENGEYLKDPQTVNHGTSANGPENQPTKTGYDFDGYDKDFTNVTSNLDIYPKFKPKKVKVFFNIGYDNASVPSGVVVANCSYDSPVSSVVPTEYTVREGYRFAGWSLSPASSTNREIYDINNPVSSLEDISLYAVWKQIFSIKFYKFQSDELHLTMSIEEGEFLSENSIPFAEGIAQQNQEAYQDYSIGYDFIWKDDATSIDQIISNPINRSINFRIIVQLKKYNVDFLIDGNIKTTLRLIIEHGKKLETLTSFPKYTNIIENMDSDKFDFADTDKWRIAGIEYSYVALLDIVVTKNLTIEPMLRIKTFMVYWKHNSTDSNDLAIYSSLINYGNEAIFRGQLPSIPGKDFDYWAVSKNSIILLREDSNGYISSVKESLTLVPTYKNKIHSVEYYDTYSGTSILEPSEASYGASIEIDNILSIHEDELSQNVVDKMFSGWDIFANARTTTVYRKQVSNNEKIWMLSHPAQNSGTSAREILSPLIIYNNECYIIKEEKINELYSYLNNISQFLAENFLKIEVVGSTWKIGSNTANERYLHFVGKVDSDNMLRKSLHYSVCDNTRFASKFVNIEYKVKFNLNGEIGAPPTEQTIVYGGKVNRPTDPTSSGKIFLGWYTEAECTTRWADFDAVVGRSMTLYAKWDSIVSSGPGVSYQIEPQGRYALVTGLTLSEIIANSGIIRIANYYDGKPVKELASYAFSLAAGHAKKIELPNTLERIGAKAFVGLVNLEYIYIPSLVNTIGVGAFDGCTGLESLEFAPSSELHSIEQMAFYQNVKLRYSNEARTRLFELPQGINNVGKFAFYGARSLKTLTFPSSLLNIGERAFANCINLNYVIFDSIAPPKIGNDVFWNDLIIEKTFKIYVLDGSFNAYKSDQLIQNNPAWAKYQNKIYSQSTIYSANGQMLWSYTLRRVDQMNHLNIIQYLGIEKDIVVPLDLVELTNLIVSIGPNAFGLGVERISISKEVNADTYAFSSALDLTSILVRVSSVERLSSASLVEAYTLPKIYKLEIASDKILSELFGGAASIPSKISEVEIYSYSNQIVQHMFADCDFIEKVTFRSTAIRINDSAFANMRSLREVNIIEAKLHEDNQNYEKIIYFGKDVFKNCINLSTFRYQLGGESEWHDGIIPHPFTSIGEDILDGTAWLNNYRENTGKDSLVLGDQILYKYLGDPNVFTKVFIIPKEIKQIATKAFANVNNVEAIIPEDINNSSLQNIGTSAFYNATSLTCLIVPNNPNSDITVGLKVFERARNLSVIVWASERGSGSILNKSLLEYFLLEENALPKDELSQPNHLSALQLYYSYNNRANWQNSQFFKSVQSRAYKNLSYFLKDGAIEWVYADVDFSTNETADFQSTLIRYLGNNPKGQTPYGGTNNFDRYGSYAFSNSVKEISLRANMNMASNTFKNINNLMSISISGGTQSLADYKLIGSKIASLINNNQSITSIGLDGFYSIQNILANEPLNSRVKTINVLEQSTRIADNFIKDQSHIEYINILSSKDGNSYSTPLEELVTSLPDKGILINEIGSKAFRNSGWYNRYPGDYIIVLDNVLVDYKGSQRVLDLCNVIHLGESIAIQRISKSAFEDENNIEAVYIPNTISRIADQAFYRASKLSKIFVMGQTTQIPQIGSSVFNDIADGYKLYSESLNVQGQLAASTNWNIYNPTLIPTKVVIPGYKWLERIDGNAYLNVRMTEYLINTQGSEHILEWLHVTINSYLVDEVVENLDYDLSTLELTKVVEVNKVEVPQEIIYGSDTYTIKRVGDNAFFSTIEELSIRMDIGLTPKALANISSLNNFHFITKGISINDRHGSLSPNYLYDIFNKANVKKISYFGNYTLDELLLNDQGARPTSLESVHITDGATETVDNLLLDWANISSFSIDKSVKKLGVNSLESTKWFQNSPDFVIVGNILYKHKGSKSEQRVNIPSNVKIINTGAFSKATGSSGNWNWQRVGYAFSTVNIDLFGGATTIHDYAFAYCANLNSINAPSSLSEIFDKAFIGTSISAQGHYLYAKDDAQKLVLMKYLGPDTTEITIDGRVRTIAARAFAEKQITRIVVPGGSNLEIIGEEAFKNTGLSYFIYALETTLLKKIGKDAFNQTNINTQDFSVKSGKKIVYTKPVGAGTFVIDDTIISITKGAIKGYSKIELMANSLLTADEMYDILSQSTVKEFSSKGMYTLAQIIGSDEKFSHIKTLSFLNGTTEIIANYAANWSDVTSVTAQSSENIISIGRNAFAGTQYLVNQDIEAARSNEGVVMFESSGIMISYSGSKDVIVSNQVKGITADTFSGNAVIESVDMSASQVKILPEGAFANCTSLASISFPSDLEYIAKDAFLNTMWIENYVGDLVVVQGMLVAYKGQEEVYIDNSITKIYPYVFSNNTTIKSVRFAQNNTISYIEPFSFENCSALEHVFLNSSINRIAPTAFRNTIYLSRNRLIYYTEFEGDIERQYKKLILSTIADNTIDSQVNEISEHAFNDAAILTNLNISSNSKLRILPDSLFDKCNSLARISIAKSSIVFGRDLFNANIPYINTAQPDSNGFVIIGNSYLVAYKGTSTSIIVPKNVKYISENAFLHATSLASVDFSQSLVKYIPSGLFKNNSNLTTVVVNNSNVNEIGKDAFANTAYIDSITGQSLLGSLIKYSGTEVVLDSSVKHIPDGFFEGQSITSITINSKVTIGKKAFANSSLSSIVNPHNIISVGESAFENTPVYSSAIDATTGIIRIGNIIIGYKGQATQDSVVIPSDVTRIAVNAFAYNHVIKNLSFAARTIDGAKLVIEKGAFTNCINLEDVNFAGVAQNITYLGYNNFVNSKYIAGLISNGTNFVVVENVLLLVAIEQPIISITKDIARIVGGVLEDSHNVVTLNINPTLSANESYSIIIGERAFKNSYKLKDIRISSQTQETIEADAFCLTTWEQGKVDFAITDKGQLLKYKPAEYKASIVLPVIVKKIYPYVFENNKYLTSIDMRLTQINRVEESIFEGCDSLVNILWSNSINLLKKSVVSSTAWYGTLADEAAYVYQNKLLFIKTNQTDVSLNDSNIWHIKEGSLDGITILRFGSNMSSNQDHLLNIDEAIFTDSNLKIYVPSDKLVSYQTRFSSHADRFQVA